MSLKALLLILWKQFTGKWGRFLLASGGIMIGIWAITFTTSLSFGLSSTIITAINSQPSAKEFGLLKGNRGQTSFFDGGNSADFGLVSLGSKDIEKIKVDNTHITDIVPEVDYSFYIPRENTLKENANFSCITDKAKQEEEAKTQAALTTLQQAQASAGVAQSVPTSASAQVVTPKTEEEVKKQVDELNQKCPQLSFTQQVWQNFYQSNKKNWNGSAIKPEKGEIVVCFKCGELKLNEKLNTKTPAEMVGKVLTLEYNRLPSYQVAGAVQENLRGGGTSSNNQEAIETQMKEPVKQQCRITAVVDDKEESFFNFGRLPIFINDSYAYDSVKLIKKDWNNDKIGFNNFSAYVDSFDNLEKTINNLRGQKYLAFSAVLPLVQGIQTAFIGLTVALSLFGLIALIASVFGIVNVMTISVLERKKEIGILKSLGARDGDIFNIFLFESSILGLVGWIMGTLLAFGCGWLVALASRLFIESNPQWRQNLSAINIEKFSPEFPLWVLLSTLALAVFFTTISGLIPAVRASRQNPVEVLRSE